MPYSWIDKLFPESTRRRVLVKLSLAALKNPLSFTRNLRWRYIKGFFFHLRNSDVQFFARMVDFRLQDGDSHVPQKVRPEIAGLEQLKVEEISALEFSSTVLPLVSIIIPVFNQWRFTYYCLKSILENTGGCDFETIVADDHSSDETGLLLAKIKGIININNERNLGFLLNCNNASRYARGKYIVFLNSDTFVLKNWLTALTSTAENETGVGIVGSKIIDKYGRLQECGWTVGKDGWALPVGRGDDPDLPQYTLLRAVDSISGSCFLVAKDIFSQLGGFDIRYAPGFYEEVDLCFAVRGRGYGVLVDPGSRIIHFGSASYGNTRRTRHVSNNHAKFYQKWKATLVRTSPST